MTTKFDLEKEKEDYEFMLRKKSVEVFLTIMFGMRGNAFKQGAALCMSLPFIFQLWLFFEVCLLYICLLILSYSSLSNSFRMQQVMIVR